MPHVKPIKILQESARFSVREVTYRGQRAVLKQAKTKKMVANLQDELLAYQLYGKITAQAGCPFGTAKLLDSGDDWILMSYLDGRPMQELINPDNRVDFYQKLAKIMAFCDDRLKVTLDGANITLPAATIAKLKERLADARQAFDQLPHYRVNSDVSLLQQAAAFVEEHAAALQACFVNPDLTVSHVMVNDDGLFLFDFENANLIGARFSDMINTATKIWFLEGDKEPALQFYDTFWQETARSPSDFTVQLKTLILKRCVGFTYELVTPPNQYHNTGQKMTQAYADNISAVARWGLAL